MEKPVSVAPPNPTDPTRAFPGDRHSTSVSGRHAAHTLLLWSKLPRTKSGFILWHTASVSWWRTQRCLVQSDTYALICAKVPAVLPSCAFQVSNPVQKANNFLVLSWKQFWPCRPHKGVSGTPEVWDHFANCCYRFSRPKLCSLGISEPNSMY